MMDREGIFFRQMEENILRVLQVVKKADMVNLAILTEIYLRAIGNLMLSQVLELYF